MRIIKLLISTLILTMSTGSAFADVSNHQKEEIISVANAVTNASEQKNLSELMRYLASDVVITVGASNKNPRSYTYQTYKEYVSKVFPLISSYKYKRANEVFGKLPNNEYSFEFDLTENYVVNGQLINESHTELWHLKYVNGSLKAYKVFIDQ